MPKKPRIVPIILAAGESKPLGFPKPLARFDGLSALEIAVRNCADLARPIVVLGWRAAQVRPAVPPQARVVLNQRWRSGQLGSLLAGVRSVPRGAAFMLYPVDCPLLTPRMIRRLVDAFQTRRRSHTVVVPCFQGRVGHPVIFSARMRGELVKARTAKEVIYRDRQRIRAVPVRSPAIWKDFQDRKTYQARLREFRQGNLPC